MEHQDYAMVRPESGVLYRNPHLMCEISVLRERLWSVGNVFAYRKDGPLT